MKKNIAMRIAAFLFILTMISTCAFATTFAKYTTSGTATDSARVAKFGVEVSTIDAATNALFKKEYTDANNGLTVKADADVVAPGTEGSFGGFTITGTPEVSVKVTYSAELTLAEWEVAGAEYCPIVIKVGTEAYYVGKDGIGDVATLITKVQEAIALKSANYEVGQQIQDTLNVSWSWAFEGNDDAKDTALGNAAADNVTDNDPTISLEITCTVTQID